MSTVNIVLLGVAGIGMLLLVGAVVNSPDLTQARRPRGYARRHGTDSDIEAWTSQAPRLARSAALEEQLVSFPVGHPEEARPVVVEERTEEQPVVPVVHRGADEQWSPAEELPPVAPLDPGRAVERRAAGRHRRMARAVSPERVADRHIAAAHAQLDDTLAPLLQRLERAGHADTDTWQWTREELAELLADQDGARR